MTLGPANPDEVYPPLLSDEAAESQPIAPAAEETPRSAAPWSEAAPVDVVPTASAVSGRSRTARLAVWLALVIGGLLFVAFGSLPVHAILATNPDIPYDAITAEGRTRQYTSADHLPVRAVWAVQANQLPGNNHQTLMQIGFYAAIAVVLLAGAAALWLALGGGRPNSPTAPVPTPTPVAPDPPIGEQ